jgi:hypothetical protein
MAAAPAINKAPMPPNSTLPAPPAGALEEAAAPVLALAEVVARAEEPDEAPVFRAVLEEPVIEPDMLVVVTAEVVIGADVPDWRAAWATTIPLAVLIPSEEQYRTVSQASLANRFCSSFTHWRW